MTILPKVKQSQRRPAGVNQSGQLGVNTSSGNSRPPSPNPSGSDPICAGDQNQPDLSQMCRPSGSGGLPQRKRHAAANPSQSGPKVTPNEPDGYNSGDEYGGKSRAEYTDEREKVFEERLKKSKRFVIKKMREDGACLFRAVADQIYGDEDMHGAVRKLSMDYMVKNSDYFSQYITEDFHSYIARKSHDSAHGNHVEMQAIAEIFNRPIEVYEYNVEPINVFHGSHRSDNAPIRLSYHSGNHYNSVVDPYAATIGVGLGLPQFHPGLADKNLMREALKTSESDDLEKAMMDDKLKATDWEATDCALTATVARDSYLQWLRDEESRKLRKTAGSSSKSLGKKLGSKPNSPAQQGNLTPPHQSAEFSQPGPSHKFSDATVNSGEEISPEVKEIIKDLPPLLFGISDWGEDVDMLTAVIAKSQQEYLDKLKSETIPPPTDKKK